MRTAGDTPADPRAGTQRAFRSVRPPLRLSYTLVKDYEDCPRCAYVKHVLGLREPASVRSLVGQVVHAALERFYKQFAEADSEGGALPGREELLRLGASELRACWPADMTPDPHVGRQVESQLGKVFEGLHDDRTHVLEVERRYELAFDVDGVTHGLEAKLDRVDQLADGGVRVVDYKTGSSRKGLTDPEKGDLQLGVYAMVLEIEGGGVPPEGVAEYWVLSDGTRGVIDLSSLNVAKARARVESACRGMLEGRFEKGADCRGLCDVLGPEL